MEITVKCLLAPTATNVEERPLKNTAIIFINSIYFGRGEQNPEKIPFPLTEWKVLHYCYVINMFIYFILFTYQDIVGTEKGT